MACPIYAVTPEPPATNLAWGSAARISAAGGGFGAAVAGGAPVGAQVSILCADNTTVSVPAVINSWSDTLIKITLPASAPSCTAGGFLIQIVIPRALGKDTCPMPLVVPGSVGMGPIITSIVGEGNTPYLVSQKRLVLTGVRFGQPGAGSFAQIIGVNLPLTISPGGWTDTRIEAWVPAVS